MASRRNHNLISAGVQAPDFTLQRLDGGDATLASLLQNGPVLLAFFKISCPVCQMTMPFLERIHQAGTLPIVLISQNEAEDTREFNQDFALTMPTLLDSEDDNFPASNAYGINTVPTLFLIERDGKIARVIESWSKRDVESLGALAGTTVFRQDDRVPEWKAG